MKKAVPYDAQAVAATIAEATRKGRTPLHRRAAFLVPALALAFTAIPFLRVGVNLLRPDRPAPAPPALDAPEAPALDAKLAAFGEHLNALRAAHPEFTDKIVAGLGHDPRATPALVAAAPTVSLTDAEADTPTGRTAELARLDGVELARLAELRAHPLTPDAARGLRKAHATRLVLARCRWAASDSPETADAALDHLLGVLAELREDLARVAPGIHDDPALMRRLAAESDPHPQAAKRVAVRFDLRLDREPDAGLRLMTAATDPGPLAADTVFEKLARFGRRKNAHREKIAELHERFGRALAQPTFREALASMAGGGLGAETRRLACMLLRDRALARLGDDHALGHFYETIPVAPREFDRLLLEFAALATADDVYGESLLLHRRAVLSKILAKHHRVRFESAATAYAVAMEYRRGLAGGKWPKSTEALLDGLLDTYPADPFTGEPPAYSRKKLSFSSPGADLTPRGGLDEPEFATDLMQLWEPTLALTSGSEPRPEAFGLHAADLEKPAPRPWEIPGKPGETAPEDPRHRPPPAGE